MAKTPKAFRLSDKAVENLQWLVEVSGSNETAVVELALAYFRQGYVSFAESSDLWSDPVPEGPPPLVAGEMLAHVASAPSGEGQSTRQGHKKRKRHR